VWEDFRGEFPGFFEVLQRADWRPNVRRRDSGDIPGRCGDYFGKVIFIYRAIDSGMISLPDVTSGRVSLAEIAEINHYLDMKFDVEHHMAEKARRERHGRKSR
jgi:hypothetical protein